MNFIRAYGASFRHAARDAIQHIDNCQFPLIDPHVQYYTGDHFTSCATWIPITCVTVRLISYDVSNVTVHDMHDTSTSIGSNPAT